MPAAASSSAARDYLHANVTLDTKALRAALTQAQADGYLSGNLAAVQQLPGAASLYGPDAKQAWDTWQPGNAPAAAKLDNGGLADLLAQSDTTINGIAGTTLDRMGTLLAEGAASGASVDSIAASLHALVTDPTRAFTIADTELARAVTSASLDAYAANNVTQWEWLVSPGACPDCEDAASGNPHTVGDGAVHPPLHPHCRCSVSPVDVPTAAAGSSSSALGA